MNIATSFADYMEDLSLGEIGSDIFLSSVPQSAPSTAWWIVSAGGTLESKNQSGESFKEYNLNVYYRHTDAEEVYNQMHLLEEAINGERCTQLNGFDTIDMTTVGFPSDQDLDSEDRTVGILQVTIRTYYKE